MVAATNVACSARAALAVRSRSLSMAAIVSEMVGSRRNSRRKRSRGSCSTVLGFWARMVAEPGSPVNRAISPKRSPGASVPTRVVPPPLGAVTKTPRPPAATM